MLTTGDNSGGYGSVNMSKLLISYLLDTYPEVELLDHMVLLHLMFRETCMLFSVMVVTSLHSYQKCTQLPFSPHSWQTYKCIL